MCCSGTAAANRAQEKKIPQKESHAELHQLIGVETLQKVVVFFCLLTISAPMASSHPTVQVLPDRPTHPRWAVAPTCLGSHTSPRNAASQKLPKIFRFFYTFRFYRTVVKKTKGNSPLTVVLVLKKTPQLAKILDEIKSPQS